MLQTKSISINDIISAALALMLVLLVVLLNTNSTGYIRGGGDDGGSGIGGTGKTMPWGGTGSGGGSGFGGTGIKPFVGINETSNELQIIDLPDTEKLAGEISAVARNILIIDPVTPIKTPVRSPLEFGASFKSSSEPISITVAIQNSIDTSALLYELPSLLQEQVGNAAEPEIITSALIGAAGITSTNGTSTNEEQQTESSASWTRLKQILAAEMETDRTTSEATEKIEISNLSTPGNETRNPERFNRIQRPELPPVQRIRPVERISILPPRIQPMRI